MIKRLADRFFSWYCNPDYYPDIKGDLEELYDSQKTNGKKLAQLKYLVDVLLLFRPALIRPLTQNSIIKDTGMFRNYFKISVRNLARHKMYTAINVIGLAIGLAGFLLIYEYIKFEKGYDSFHQDADQLHRVSYVRVINGIDGDKDAMASRPVGSVLTEEIPEVLQYTVTKKLGEMIVKRGNVFFKEEAVITADSNFLKLFNYRVLAGSPDDLLSEPNSIVLTESRAFAYFGSEDPLGKTLESSSHNQLSLKVTGIIEDIPDNTHYKFDMMISEKTFKDSDDYESWNWNNYYVFIKVAPGTNMLALDEKAYQATKRFIDGEDDRDIDNRTRLDIHPVQDIHLKSDFTYEPQVHGSEKAVTFLIIISIFILVIAWVNYVNLSTARAMDRAKEVGLRKVIGAFRKQLVIQFLCEALLINLFSAMIALVLAELAVPFFNQLVGKEIIGHVWNHQPFFISLIVFAMIGALASGFYPALVMSDFKPIAVLKGKYINSKKGVLLRKGLVVAQFAASMILVAATLIIYLQINFMRGRDLGISVERVVSAAIPETDYHSDQEAFIARLNSFKRQLSSHSAIEAIGGSSNLPGGDAGDINSTTTPVKIVGLSDPLEGTTYVQYNDDGLLEALDMSLYAGRNFDRNLKSDSSAVLANETFLRRFNIPDIENLVGEKVQFGTDETNRKYQIVGIVKDFNRTSLKTVVEPTLYFPWLDAHFLAIELSEANYMAGLEHLEKTWEEFYPANPLDYTFLDERFASLYEQDQRFGDTFLVFASLAILVAILGLFGLSSFLSLQRSKEVGVRKVLGATKGQIVSLFYKDFLSLVGLSALVGFPTVYFLMDGWLNNYAYRVDFPWVLLIVSLLIVLIFALTTVGYQTAKVASADPAKTLKYE